jgi:hypothetical protein
MGAKFMERSAIGMQVHIYHECVIELDFDIFQWLSAKHDFLGKQSPYSVSSAKAFLFVFVGWMGSIDSC